MPATDTLSDLGPVSAVFTSTTRWRVIALNVAMYLAGVSLAVMFVASCRKPPSHPVIIVTVVAAILASILVLASWRGWKHIFGWRYTIAQRGLLIQRHDQLVARLTWDQIVADLRTPWITGPDGRRYFLGINLTDAQALAVTLRNLWRLHQPQAYEQAARRQTLTSPRIKWNLRIAVGLLTAAALSWGVLQRHWSEALPCLLLCLWLLVLFEIVFWDERIRRRKLDAMTRQIRQVLTALTDPTLPDDAPLAQLPGLSTRRRLWTLLGIGALILVLAMSLPFAMALHQSLCGRPVDPLTFQLMLLLSALIALPLVILFIGGHIAVGLWRTWGWHYTLTRTGLTVQRGSGNPRLIPWPQIACVGPRKLIMVGGRSIPLVFRSGFAPDLVAYRLIERCLLAADPSALDRLSEHYAQQALRRTRSSAQ